MSDKTQREHGDFFAIPGITAISLDGRDAIAFAQAQFMNDVAALGTGEWHWSGWLTPKGRLIALFAVLRQSDESLLLLLMDADANAFVAQLQRFVFRSKVVLNVREDLHASGGFVAPVDASGARFVQAGEGRLELDAGTREHPRTLRIGTETPRDDAASSLEWRRFDIAHGLPRLDAQAEPQWTPQQLSLDRLKAYSVKKGCYPGQEIVARTHFLGQAKRGLVRLQGPSVGELDEVMAGAPTGDVGITVSRPIGQVICAAGDEGLAVMPLDAGDGPFHSDGAALSPLPLLEGLAR